MRHRIFLDANVLFSVAYRSGSGLERLWTLGAGTVLLSTAYAVEEARRNLAAVDARERLAELAARIELVPNIDAGPVPERVILPEKDRPILLAALAAGATHLLTGDRTHFGPYYGTRVEGLLIERPGDYLRRELPE